MTLPLPTSPLVDAAGNITAAWRAFVLAVSGDAAGGPLATSDALAAETARATAAEADLQNQIIPPALGGIRAGTDVVDSASNLTLAFTPAFPNTLLYFAAVDPTQPTAAPLTITAMLSYSRSAIRVTVHNTSGALPAGTAVGWYAIGN